MLAAPFTQCAESVTQLWLAQLQQSQLVLSGCWREFRESKEPVRYLPVVVIKITGRPASLAGKDRLRNQTASVCRSWCCFDVSRPRFRKWISKALQRGKSQENVLSESSDCYCVAHFVRQFIRTFPLNPTQLIEKSTSLCLLERWPGWVWEMVKFDWSPLTGMQQNWLCLPFSSPLLP